MNPQNVASGRKPFIVQAVLLFLVALALRGAYFGNPVLGADEQFYLLVGDRILHGAVPYVDIWDRKPIGLFLIYAGTRLLGGGGIYQYQIVALIFAATTAIVIVAIASHFARRFGAVAAGIVYLIWLHIFGGEGGQSPVFYNLFMALAAYLIVKSFDQPPAVLARLGCAAMLLVGLAIQVKYTAIFEGMFFGCFLLWRAYRSGFSARHIIGCGAIWIGGALLPTALALSTYVWLGHGDAFIFANFLSIFERLAPEEGSALYRLALIAIRLLPLALCAALGCLLPLDAGPAHRPPNVAARTFVAGWSLVAIAAVLLFGTYYRHYALPLLVPLAVAAAPALEQWRIGRLTAREPGAWRVLVIYLLCLCGLTIAMAVNVNYRRQRGEGAEVSAIAAFIKPQLRDCLFVFDGEPVLYYLTGSCLPTRYAFPSHLNDPREAGAIGVDQWTEVNRILGERPRFVVSSLAPRNRADPRVWNALAAELNRHYRRALEVPVGRRTRVVYERVDDAS
jgi:hypothetical protein